MEPGAGARRRRPRALIPVGRGGEVGVGPMFLGVELLNHAEPAELPIRAIEVAVVIAVAGHQPAASDPVVGLDPLDYLHRERKPSDPGTAVPLILEIEAGGRRVANPGLRAEIV